MTEKTETTLKDKAIKIGNKDYVLVSDRVIAFNETYKNGTIQTKLLSAFDSDMVVMMAKVTPDMDKPERYFTGYSQATWGDGMVNKTAALENCETSAVGRALGFMGIGVLDSIASVDEVNKAKSQPAYDPKTATKPVSGLIAHCSIHDTDMQERVSKKTGQPYFSHIKDEGGHCFGLKEDQPKLAQAVKSVENKVDNNVDNSQDTDSFDQLAIQVSEDIPY